MKIPVVMQFDSSDCGVACASSICYHYGKEISISRLRDMMGTDAYGTSVNGLVSGLKSIGFEVHAVKAPKESIGDGDFTMPAIARIITNDGMAHYVVIYSVSKGKVMLMDPEQNHPVKCTVDEFLCRFDGALILMIPTDAFYSIPSDRHAGALRYSRMIRPHLKLFIIAVHSVQK